MGRHHSAQCVSCQFPRLWHRVKKIIQKATSTASLRHAVEATRDSKWPSARTHWSSGDLAAQSYLRSATSSINASVSSGRDDTKNKKKREKMRKPARLLQFPKQRTTQALLTVTSASHYWLPSILKTDSFTSTVATLSRTVTERFFNAKAFLSLVSKHMSLSKSLDKALSVKYLS